MIRSDLEKLISDGFLGSELGLKLSGTASKEVLRVVLRSILTGLEQDGIVTITGFGTFRIVDYRARPGVNPSTRQTISLPGGKRVRFTAGKAFRDLKKRARNDG